MERCWKLYFPTWLMSPCEISPSAGDMGNSDQTKVGGGDKEAIQNLPEVPVEKNKVDSKSGVTF